MTESEQARADVLRDALRRLENYTTVMKQYIDRGWAESAYITARWAARAAFRAVPGLRG